MLRFLVCDPIQHGTLSPQNNEGLIYRGTCLKFCLKSKYNKIGLRNVTKMATLQKTLDEHIICYPDSES